MHMMYSTPFLHTQYNDIVDIEVIRKCDATLDVVVLIHLCLTLGNYRFPFSAPSVLDERGLLSGAIRRC